MTASDSQARTLMGEASSVFCRTQRANPLIAGEDVATIVLQHGGEGASPVVGGGTTVVTASYAPTEAPFAFPQTAIRIVGVHGQDGMRHGACSTCMLRMMRALRTMSALKLRLRWSFLLTSGRRR